MTITDFAALGIVGCCLMCIALLDDVVSGIRPYP
jgi:hypothetical protein